MNMLLALPDEGKVLVFSLVTAVVAWLLAKINMGQYTQALAAVFAPIVITAVESWLAVIPPVFDDLTVSLLHLVVLFVSALGATVFVKRFKTPEVWLNGHKSAKG